MKGVLDAGSFLYIPKEFYPLGLDLEIAGEILKKLNNETLHEFRKTFKDFDEDRFLTLKKYRVSRIYTDPSLDDFYFAKFIRESARKIARIFGMNYIDAKTPIVTRVWLFVSENQQPYQAEFKNHEYFDELTFTTTVFNSFKGLVKYGAIQLYVSQTLNTGKFSLFLNYGALYEKLDLI